MLLLLGCCLLLCTVHLGAAVKMTLGSQYPADKTEADASGVQKEYVLPGSLAYKALVPLV